MERLFENQYKHSKEFYREFCSYTFLKSPSIIFVKLLLIALLGVLVLSLIASANLTTPLSTNALVLGFTVDVILWIIVYIMFFRIVKLKCSQEWETNNGEFFEVNLRVMEDGIEFQRVNTESESHIIVPYGKIRKVRKTKNYCILFSDAKIGYAFKNDCFIHGTHEEFLSFLRSKGFKC